MTSALEDGYGRGKVSCWWLRWEDFCLPGRWCITVLVPGGNATNLNAVVDDFGNLVVVA